jgi:hypothetical protein
MQRCGPGEKSNEFAEPKAKLMASVENKMVDLQTVIDAIATASMPPHEAFSAIRALLDPNPTDAAVQKAVYAALRSVAWRFVSGRAAGSHLPRWADVILRVRQMFRSAGSPIAERLTVLADLLEQSENFAHARTDSELLGGSARPDTWLVSAHCWRRGPGGSLACYTLESRTSWTRCYEHEGTATISDEIAKAIARSMVEQLAAEVFPKLLYAVRSAQGIDPDRSQSEEVPNA